MILSLHGRRYEGIYLTFGPLPEQLFDHLGVRSFDDILGKQRASFLRSLSHDEPP